MPVISDQPPKSGKGVEQQVLLPRIAFPILAADETDAGVVHTIETPALADGNDHLRLGRDRALHHLKLGMRGVEQRAAMTAQSAHRLAGGLQLNRRTAGGAIQGVAAGGFFFQAVSGPARERAQVAEFQLGEGAGVADEDPNSVRGKLHVGELPVGRAQINARGGAPRHGHEG